MMDGEGYERKGSWTIIRYYFRVCLERTRENMKNLNQDSRCLG
jgi:hypothetical protein